MSVKQTLQKARELILDPTHWIKGEFAQSEDKKYTANPWHPNMKCFCIRGAVYAAVNEGKWTDSRCAAAMNFLEYRLEEETGWHRRLLANWNDHPKTTHADVIGLLDIAIEKAPDD